MSSSVVCFCFSSIHTASLIHPMSHMHARTRARARTHTHTLGVQYQPRDTRAAEPQPYMWSTIRRAWITDLWMHMLLVWFGTRFTASQCKALMWFNSFILMGLSFPRMTASPSIELYWTVRLLWSSQPLDLSTDLASVGSSFWVTIVESLGTRKFCPRAPLNVNPALSLCEEASNLWF